MKQDFYRKKLRGLAGKNYRYSSGRTGGKLDITKKYVPFMEK